MQRLWLTIQRGYLRIIEPFAAWLVRAGVGPNTITTIGTLTYMIGGAIYADGHIRTAGWWLGLTAMFDVLDGKVARASGKTTVFGAFYDSTLDRVADGAVLGGLLIFFARNDVLHGVPHWSGTPMVALTLFGIVGTFLTSYTRARAEALGLEGKAGLMGRAERVVLLGAVLLASPWGALPYGIAQLAALSAFTVGQRILSVHQQLAAQRSA
jgi:phosphatidylglycerophosphate synthase